MKKLLLLITILFAGIMIPARAYDLVVSMVNEETGKKISEHRAVGNLSGFEIYSIAGKE